MKENSKKAGIHLLEKGKRGIFRVIFSRSGLILVLLAMQVLFLFSIFHWFEAFLPHIYGGVVIFTFFMVLYLLNSAMDPTAKITCWWWSCSCRCSAPCCFFTPRKTLATGL